jgi:membrane peptidoglycan carboxypeptidase
VGYTPDIVTGVWTGNNDSSPTTQGEGVFTAGPIWNTYMRQVLPTLSRDTFPSPPDIFPPDKPMLNGKIGEGDSQEITIDKKTGKLAEDGCPDKCTKKVTVSNGHCILYYVDRNDPLGPAPKDPTKDPQFQQWEDGVQKWGGDHSDNGDKKDKKDIITSMPTDTSCSCKKGN